jgi:transcriptional regulator with XRE-family HTH domain
MIAIEKAYLSRMSPLSIRLREVREKKGFTQAVLAKKAGVQQGTISKIERGKAKALGLDNLEAIARALGVRAKSLLVETPAPKARRKR